MSDEEARALLHEMQLRLAEGPHAALGVPMHATAADIRSAFLQLTKTFHPARFGRMASHIQRQSNEVFLALRAAHDQISKPKRSQPTTASPPLGRPPTKPFGVPVSPATRPGVSPTTPRTPAPTHERTGQTQPIARPQSGPIPDTRAAQPAATSQQPNARPSTPSVPKPNNSTAPIPTLRTTSPTPGPPAVVRAVASSSNLEALDPVLAPFLELIGRGELGRAQTTIDALVARHPQNKRYAAYAAYARARKAMADGDIRGAQIDLNEALALDPQNELAKSAIGQVMRRK